jgi:hypothetical protein
MNDGEQVFCRDNASSGSGLTVLTPELFDAARKAKALSPSGLDKAKKKALADQ